VFNQLQPELMLLSSRPAEPRHTLSHLSLSFSVAETHPLTGRSATTRHTGVHIYNISQRIAPTHASQRRRGRTGGKHISPRHFWGHCSWHVLYDFKPKTPHNFVRKQYT